MDHAHPAPPIFVIVNADDFGCSSSVNRAIVDCFERRFISSTTIMANTPAFEEACALARHHGFTEKIGVHINLTLGRPLTEPIRRCRTFCNDQRLFSYRAHSGIRFTQEEERCLRAELDAQIERCKEQQLPLSHADTHQNIHIDFRVSRILASVLKAHGIPYLRLIDTARGGSFFKRLYKKHLNWLLIEANGLRGADCFCSETGMLPSFMQERSARPRVIEVMTHPDFTADGILVNAEYDSRGMRLEDARSQRMDALFSICSRLGPLVPYSAMVRDDGLQSGNSALAQLAIHGKEGLSGNGAH